MIFLMVVMALNSGKFVPPSELPVRLQILVQESEDAWLEQDWETSRQAALRALVMSDPDNEALRMFLRNRVASIYLRQGAYRDAIRHLDILIASGIENEILYHNLGLACQEDKQYLRAIEAYRKALEHAPEFVESLYGLAVCEIHSNHYEEGMATLVRLKKLVPLFHEADYWSGVVQANLGKEEDALVCFNDYVKHDPDGKFIDAAQESVAHIKTRARESVFLRATLGLVLITGAFSLYLLAKMP